MKKQVADVEVPQFSAEHKAEIFKLQRNSTSARLRKQEVVANATKQADAEIAAADKALNDRITALATEYKINTPEFQFDPVELVVIKNPQPAGVPDGGN